MLNEFNMWNIRDLMSKHLVSKSDQREDFIYFGDYDFYDHLCRYIFRDPTILYTETRDTVEGDGSIQDSGLVQAFYSIQNAFKRNSKYRNKKPKPLIPMQWVNWHKTCLGTIKH